MDDRTLRIIGLVLIWAVLAAFAPQILAWLRKHGYKGWRAQNPRGQQ